jgi:hypothetical protein
VLRSDFRVAQHSATPFGKLRSVAIFRLRIATRYELLRRPGSPREHAAGRREIRTAGVKKVSMRVPDLNLHLGLDLKLSGVACPRNHLYRTRERSRPIPGGFFLFALRAERDHVRDLADQLDLEAGLDRPDDDAVDETAEDRKRSFGATARLAR